MGERSSTHQDNEVLRHAFAIPNPDRSPLYDVRNPAGASCEGRRMRSDVFADDKLGDRVQPVFAQEGSAGHASPFGPCVAAPRVAEGEAWWSQTGSNRRPHACKARALPAELWPRNQKTNASRRLLSCISFKRKRTRSKWWAWEDLNFRPHAYQARALTN